MQSLRAWWRPALVIEASRHPEVSGPPAHRRARRCGARGPDHAPLEAVEAEVKRARDLVARLSPKAPLTLVKGQGGGGTPGSDAFLSAFLRSLGVERNVRKLTPEPKSYMKASDGERR